MAREAGGDDFVLTIDANQGYTAAGALDLCRRLEGLNVRWFEEPCRWHNDKRALRDVRMRGGIPVCAGQSEYTPSGCRDLMETGSIDVCNFDASWTGGPTVWRRTAAIALAYDVQMGHHEEPQVASHLLASQPHGTYVGVLPPRPRPVLVEHHRQPAASSWTASCRCRPRPGLGWELDWDYIERHRADR